MADLFDQDDENIESIQRFDPIYDDLIVNKWQCGCVSLSVEGTFNDDGLIVRIIDEHMMQECSPHVDL